MLNRIATALIKKLTVSVTGGFRGSVRRNVKTGWRAGRDPLWLTGRVAHHSLVTR